MLQLPDITGPRVFHQLTPRLPAQPFDRFLVFPAIQPLEMIGQHQDILSPLTQRWYGYLYGIDPIEQVLPETPLAHQLTQIGVGGADQTNIDRDRFHRSQTGDMTFLYSRQQFRLHRQGQVTDLVQKERTTGGHLHPSRLRPSGIREGSFLIAEQLTLK